MLDLPHSEFDDWGFPVDGGNAVTLPESGLPDPQTRLRVSD